MGSGHRGNSTVNVNGKRQRRDGKVKGKGRNGKVNGRGDGERRERQK